MPVGVLYPPSLTIYSQDCGDTVGGGKGWGGGGVLCQWGFYDPSLTILSGPWCGYP